MRKCVLEISEDNIKMLRISKGQQKRFSMSFKGGHFRGISGRFSDNMSEESRQKGA